MFKDSNASQCAIGANGDEQADVAAVAIGRGGGEGRRNSLPLPPSTEDRDWGTATQTRVNEAQRVTEHIVVEFPGGNQRYHAVEKCQLLVGQDSFFAGVVNQGNHTDTDQAEQPELRRRFSQVDSPEQSANIDPGWH